MTKKPVLIGLCLGLLFLGAVLAGCVRPRSNPAPLPTKLSLGSTQAPTSLPPQPTATSLAPGTQEPTATATVQVVTATLVAPEPTATTEPSENLISTEPTPTTAPTDTLGGTTYEVRWGDTLSSIARRFGTTISAIMASNPRITNRNRIFVGMVLTIPSGSESTPVEGGPTAEPGGQTGEAVDYVVQRGDSLSGIARRFGTTVEAIVQANPWITNRNYIQAGKHLAVPTSVGMPPSTGARTHVVRSGETLSSIARMYNTTVWAIAVRNNLGNSNLIYAGQVLTIP